MLDGHVSTRIHASDLLEEAPQESVSTSNKRLECNFIAGHVVAGVKKDTLAVSSHLLEQVVPFQIFAEEEFFQIGEIDCLSVRTWNESTLAVEQVGWELPGHAI